MSEVVYSAQGRLAAAPEGRRLEDTSPQTQTNTQGSTSVQPIVGSGRAQARGPSAPKEISISRGLGPGPATSEVSRNSRKSRKSRKTMSLPTLGELCPVTPLLRCDPRMGATTVSSMDGHIWRWAGNIPPGFEPEFEPRLAHYSKCYTHTWFGSALQKHIHIQFGA